MSSPVPSYPLPLLLTFPSRRSFPGIPGLFGWVMVNEQPLEVCHAGLEGNKVSAFVEAQDGQQFEVAYLDARKGEEVHDSYQVRVTVDGRR